MAITQNTYTGNGSTVLYSFAFPYLETTDVKVSINGTVTTAYTFANATTIQFNTAPANGAAIRIYRETDDSALQAVFSPGSSIRASDLNDNFDQTLYVVQEINNNAVKLADPLYANKTYIDAQDALKVNKAGDTMSGNLAMGNNKVTGLGAPTASADAVTKSYVDGYINTTYLGPSATDPATRPGGSPLQVGDQYFNTNQNILKAWTGTVWVISAAAGSIIRWRKTASAGNTTLSGVDDLGITLSYVVGNEQVFLNGALQTRGVDYTAATGTSITFTPALLAGDVVELHAVQGYVSATVPDGSVGENKLAAGAVTSAKIADGTIVDADVNASAGIVASKLSFTQTGAGAVARTVQSKLTDIINVLDFGVVGDGTTNNTTAYANLVAAAPAGSTIYWPPGTYVGTLYSTKALNLVGGPNVILKAASPAAGDAIIRFEGVLAPYSNLSAAPAWGDRVLSGVAGLAAGDLVLLYSGSQRPGDNAPVNYEMVRMVNSTTVEGQVMSAQTGGTPRYAKVTPIYGITVSGFQFDLGTTAGTASNAVAAVWVRFAQNLKLENIHATGGYGSTVRVDFCYDVYIENTSRIRPYDTGSGNGYHVALGANTNVHASEVRGVSTRHTFDADSCYFLSLRNCLSQNGKSSDIVITHNGFGGSHTYENVKVIDPAPDTYSIHNSSQGIAVADLPNQVCRDIKIYNFRSIRRQNPTSASPAIYFQYSSQDINIQDVVIENPVGTSFANQMAIRFSGPIQGKSSIIGCRISSYDWGIYFNNDVSNSTFPRHSDETTIRDISCYRVKTPIYDDTAAGQFLYLDVANVEIEDSASYGFDCYMRIARSHNGTTSFALSQMAVTLENSRNKIVANTGGHYVVFKNDAGSLLSSSLTPVSNTLTQGNMVSAGGPTGRILQATTVTTVDAPAGMGQAVLFLCNGAVSISDAATVVGTVTGTAGQTIKLISNGSTWRKIDTPGSW